MTILLTIEAPPDAPVACDMRGAADTLAERLAEYRRLFEHALVEKTSDEVREEGDEIVWTTTGGLGASEMAAVDELFEGGALDATSVALAARLSERGLPVIVP